MQLGTYKGKHFAEVSPWWTRHRGPYVLAVGREFTTKPGFHRTEWLSGTLSGEEAMEEALAILSDPRDPQVRTVSVWSRKEQQFVMTYRRSDVESLRRAA